MIRIESVKNERVKAWKKLHTRKGREKAGLFLIEGFHLVEEAMKAGVDMEAILIKEGVSLSFSAEINGDMIVVNEAVLNVLSETKTPQGVMAVCRMKKGENMPRLNEGIFLLVDRVQDPGNLGTMIRTADSAGATAIVLGEGTVDLYNDKVIRSSQGSLFHLPIYRGKNLLDVIDELKQNQIPVYGTALQGASRYEQIEKQQSFALLVGNEGEGVSEELLQATDQNIYIPIYGKAESLNVAVATGILLYSLRKG